MATGVGREKNAIGSIRWPSFSRWLIACDRCSVRRSTV